MHNGISFAVSQFEYYEILTKGDGMAARIIKHAMTDRRSWKFLSLERIALLPNRMRRPSSDLIGVAYTMVKPLTLFIRILGHAASCVAVPVRALKNRVRVTDNKPKILIF